MIIGSGPPLVIGQTLRVEVVEIERIVTDGIATFADVTDGRRYRAVVGPADFRRGLAVGIRVTITLVASRATGFPEGFGRWEWAADPGAPAVAIGADGPARAT